jgi:heme exporter protein A
VTGPNGSGKSSLIRLAAGLLRAERGQVERNAAAALADDNLALDRELPLARALRFWGSDEGLERMGLTDLERVPVRYLSSGQRKRATIARVIGSGAPLWLLDEPANALDGDGVERLAEALAAHRSNGGAILAASHLPLPGQWQGVKLGS